MEANRASLFGVPVFGSGVTKVYVILRVFNISMEVSRDVGMKIFVDPTRLRGRALEFGSRHLVCEGDGRFVTIAACI
jgi:hypothetical protein